eukprot:Trichotokara_eunicae@DN5891_c0_g1_i1.p1
MNEVACKGSCWNLPYVWSILLKYIVPFITHGMAIGNLLSDTHFFNRPSKEEPYLWWVMLLGFLGPCAVVIGLLGSLLYPPFANIIMPPEHELHLFDVSFATGEEAEGAYRIVDASKPKGSASLASSEFIPAV